MFNFFKRDPHKGVYAYQRSELTHLKGSCKFCKRIDNKVFEPGHPMVNMEKSELDECTNKEGCKGVWVAILKDEVDPPPITEFKI